MRLLLREAVVWVIGYPLSVVVAAIVLAGVFVAASVPTFSRDLAAPFEPAVASMQGILTLVAVFSLIPALVTRYGGGARGGDAGPYFRAGTWTGFAFGVLTTAPLIPLLLTGAFKIAGALIAGEDTASLVQGTGMIAALIAVGVSLFMVAGACGGATFGFVARWTDRR